MQDSKNNRELHFDTVDYRQLVGSGRPHWILPSWIDTAVVRPLVNEGGRLIRGDIACRILNGITLEDRMVHVIAGPKDVGRDCKELIVDKATVG